MCTPMSRVCSRSPFSPRPISHTRANVAHGGHPLFTHTLSSHVPTVCVAALNVTVKRLKYALQLHVIPAPGLCIAAVAAAVANKKIRYDRRFSSNDTVHSGMCVFNRVFLGHILVVQISNVANVGLAGTRTLTNMAFHPYVVVGVLFSEMRWLLCVHHMRDAVTLGGHALQRSRRSDYNDDDK